ncbi:bifunctional DNA primase/polymerase [Streptomyces venezuelae]|uniref:bifunctional DNA primase/polymerase n=1 Tax=Streptomyces venezuelae TaxID=54571 RepID=UPI00168162C6|nr:bifunctional DNA primase/polymerase [Streptomyces venezuelae]
MNLIAHAVAAWQRGFTIFPCNPAGTVCPQSGDIIDKQPHLVQPGKPYKIRWGEWATRDLDRIIAAWTASPVANPAIACGPSGLLVVDCDVAKGEYALKGTPFESLHDRLGPLVDGHDALREICKRCGGDFGELNDTFAVTTGSMGLHLYFRWPTGLRASQASPVKGLVDVRGNGGQRGGYVLAAGSVTTKGPYVAENGLPVRDAPPWLVELCREKPAPPRPLFAQPRRGGSIGGLVDTVRDAAPGNRSNALYWAARSACSDGIPIEDAVDQLGAAYSGDGGQRQAEATVRSAYRNQQRKEGL